MALVDEEGCAEIRFEASPSRYQTASTVQIVMSDIDRGLRPMGQQGIELSGNDFQHGDTKHSQLNEDVFKPPI
jgi:hypothetical protein